jgi:hypothetical protein
MNYVKRIYIKYQKDGIWRVVSFLLKKIKIQTKYSSFIHKKKTLLAKDIIKLTKCIVGSGYYKSLKLKGDYNWNKDNIDISSKLLGCYEQQVQEKIIELKNKYKLKYLINFGAGEGFHALGLIKNNYFRKALCFEINKLTRNILFGNIKINKINKKILIFSKANFKDIANNLNAIKLKRSLFLVDIEGEEFNLFNQKNLIYYKNSFLIIENHQNFFKNKKIKNVFFKLINKNFNVKILNDGGRNPNLIKKLENLNDDEKWLLMSENRPCRMNWIILIPKSVGY